MSKPLYGSEDVSEYTSTEAFPTLRPSHISIYKCNVTGWYSAKDTRKNVFYPLLDRLDPESVVTKRVFDGSNFTAN